MLEKRTRKSEITIFGETYRIVILLIQKLEKKFTLIFLIALLIIFNSFIGYKVQEKTTSYIIKTYTKFEYYLNHSIGEIIRFFENYAFLKNKYHETVKENKKLKMQWTKLQNLKFENEKLQKLLFFVSSNQVEVKSTKLLWKGDFTSNIIEIGEVHGILPGQLVICENGVLGRVNKVFTDFSTIKPIFLETNFPVFILRTGQKFMVSGTTKNNMLKILFLEKKSMLRERDQVFTYGISGKVPEGLYVGTIVKINDEFYVSTKINCDKLHFVSVITNSRRNDVSPKT